MSGGQTMRDKHHRLSLIYGIFKKDTNELICRTEIDSQNLKNLWLPKGHVEAEGMTWGFQMEVF